MKRCFAFAALLASLIASSDAANVRILRSVLRGTKGNEGIFGLVAVTESDDGSVTIEGEVTGLPDRPAGDLFGFHVHQYGDEIGKADGTAAGGHFNPLEQNHAGPDPDAAPNPRHIGDLGNIQASGGTAQFSIKFRGDDPYRPTVVSDMKNSIVGRSFVVHAGEDDQTTQPTGNAGARLAVGVIGIGNDALYNEEIAAGGPQAVEVTEHVDSDLFEEPKALVCNIRGDTAAGYGSAEPGDGKVLLGARVKAAIPNGVHGFHVHWYGEEYKHAVGGGPPPARDLSRAGGHYNPSGADHALPPDDPRHYGDGGSVLLGADGVGSARTALPAGLATLKHLVGRTCVVHADADDGSQPSGNAGARIAAGQLGYANPETCTDPAVCLLPGEEDGSGGPARRSAWAAAVSGGLLVSVLLGV